MTKYYILTTGGLDLTANILNPSAASQVQAFTGGKLLRRLAGVASDAGIAAYVSPDPWTHTFDFTESNGDFTIDTTGGHTRGVWADGIGWESSFHVSGSVAYRTVQIRRDVSIATTITDITVNYTMTTGTLENSGDINYIGRLTPSLSVLYSNAAHTALPDPMVWSGTQAFSAGQDFQVAIYCGIDMGSVLDPGGTLTIESIVVEGTGNNPFGDGQIITSTDSGSTIDTITVAGGGFPANGCFDADDYNAGVIVVGAGSTIHYANAYDDAATTELTSLTGLNGTAKVVCIRIPYLKLATQAANDAATSMQFIYGVDAAVSGKTLWGVTFNANTGAIAAESDMTPIISATTYYVIGPNALVTYGGNTQRIAALVKPVGGGSTRLIVSTNGGTSWTDRGTIDCLSVEFGSTGTELWLAGAAGVRRSLDFGATLLTRTGDLNTETGLSTAIKAMVI
jgi:hypothetical protein